MSAMAFKAMVWTPPYPTGIYVLRLKLILTVNGNKKESTMKITRVGVDLAKNVFQLHGVDRSGKCVWKRKLSRKKWLKTLLEQTDPSCEIVM